MKGSVEFELAVSKLFQHWDVLHQAVSSHFGGIHSKEKSEWLPNVVVDFFSRNKDLESSEVESFISEIMDTEFDLLVEDGSSKRLSNQLCRCFAWARDERYQELNDFLSSLQPVPVSVAKVESDDDSEEDGKKEEPMEVDEANQRRNQSMKAPIVDEDGFTLVVGKKKR